MCGCVCGCVCVFALTISGHAHRQALLEAAVLAAVAVHAHDQAVLVLHTHLIVDVLLDAPAEEALEETESKVYDGYIKIDRDREREERKGKKERESICSRLCLCKCLYLCSLCAGSYLAAFTGMDAIVKS